MKLRRSDKKPLFFHLTLFIMTAALVFFLSMRVTPAEKEKYHQLMEEVVSEQLPKEYQAKQQRSDIHRELIITHKNTRLQTRLTANKGTLILNHDFDKPGFTEKLEGITCMIQEAVFYKTASGREVIRQGDGSFVSKNKKEPISQEELGTLTPMQTFRYIQSNEASLDYRTNMLTTQRMTFARYTAPGHELPMTLDGLKVDLAGTATTAEVVFKDTGPEFQAKQLQLNLPNARIP